MVQDIFTFYPTRSYFLLFTSKCNKNPQKLISLPYCSEAIQSEHLKVLVVSYLHKYYICTKFERIWDECQFFVLISHGITHKRHVGCLGGIYRPESILWREWIESWWGILILPYAKIVPIGYYWLIFILSCINHCIENMATITTLAKVFTYNHNTEFPLCICPSITDGRQTLASWTDCTSHLSGHHSGSRFWLWLLTYSGVAIRKLTIFLESSRTQIRHTYSHFAHLQLQIELAL